MAERREVKRQRFPLLVYEGQWEAVLWPAILVALASTVMFVWNPPTLRPYRFLWLLVAVLALALLGYRWWARSQAYVEVWADGILVQVPFHELVVPFGNVDITRPTVLHQHFSAEALRERAMGPLYPYLRDSAIVVELKEWPRPPAWIRRNLGPYFLAADCDGLVLTVADWLTLHRKIDVAMETWRGEHLPSPQERFRRMRGGEPAG